MPVFDIFVLSLICAVFAAFGILLASVSWYCRSGRPNAKQPTNDLHVPANWIVDD